jgi:hypothetical protein
MLHAYNLSCTVCTFNLDVYAAEYMFGINIQLNIHVYAVEYVRYKYNCTTRA